MAGQRSDARKRQDEAMLREAERLDLNRRVLRALQRVYPTAEWIEGHALRDALEDEGVISG